LAQQASGYNASNKNFSITKEPMCMHVQNQSLCSGAETGLTGNPIGLTGVLGIQTGLTNTPPDMTGPAIPDNPVLEDSASNNLEHDKANMLIGGDLLLIICKIQVTKLIERFGGLLSSLRW
jgi:hypothetical protein